MTTKKEIYTAGKERGECIAMWTDLPEIGSKVEGSLAYEVLKVEIEDVDDAKDVFFSLVYRAEESDREYTPFELMAKELNDLAEVKPYDPWVVFEDGIRVGIGKNWKERKGYYTKKGDDK